MAESRGLKSQSVISIGGIWSRSLVLSLGLFCFSVPIVLAIAFSVHSLGDYFYLKHIEVGKNLSSDFEKKMCSRFFLRCLEASEYSFGAFRPEGSDSRRLFVQSLIEIDGGADYFDLDNTRRVIGKSRISSP